MPFIKKMVMRGFKSFAHETEIPMENAMNVIVGPNGSGKSNVGDAICFVLGRISAKSMRAEKSANLIFAGTKIMKPSPEASVKMVFDNTDKAFSIDNNEISIERIVRRNGQSIYKINNETKTRQEVLELLSQAGIDPQGFNIVLQGEIQSITKMHSQERRQVIEEVAGISVYETRKEKSLHELEKTDERLKEVSAILRERTSYLRNLENERQQALKFKQLEETVKRCKASILHRQIEEKKKSIKNFDEEISKKQKSRDNFRKETEKLQSEISEMKVKTEQINSHIQQSSGLEQETLRNELTELRSSLAGLTVKKETSESRLQEIIRRRAAVSQDIGKLEIEIVELRKSSPMQAKKKLELEQKKLELEKIDAEKKKVFRNKIELDNLKLRLEDKQRQLERIKSESQFVIREMEKSSTDLQEKSPDSCDKKIKLLLSEVKLKEKELEDSEKSKLSLEKELSVLDSQINEQENIKKDLEKIDICPLCKTKITPDHINHVFSDCDSRINESSEKKRKASFDLDNISQKIIELKAGIISHKSEISSKNIELVRLNNIELQKSNLKRLDEQEKNLAKEISELESIRVKQEQSYQENKNVEETAEKLLLEIEQISARTEENLDAELQFKERDMDSMKLVIKQSHRDDQDLKEEIITFERQINEQTKKLEVKQEQEQDLQERFKKLFLERDETQKKIEDHSARLLNKQHEQSLEDNQMNNIKIEKARIDAERETLETDYLPFRELQLILASPNELHERLQKSEDSLRIIGSVNLRALDVYDQVKKEYDSIAEKSSQLEQEKLEIMKIIDEIDNKKRRTFMKTLLAINELFTRNFIQLSTKGQVFLELENKEDPFAAGLGITIKVGKGKYFDITSLSGGEQTLVALSLIFAIQEYKPYCFYIFDEVDAALDKRNSERLATLIKRYMRTGQYIVITHNDAIITESTTLYGVTMQEGISKVLSLQI
jgi:chromosome segregation protein